MATQIVIRSARSWAVLCTGVILSLAVPLAAQQTGPISQTLPPPAGQTGQTVTKPQTAPAAPGGPTLDLTMAQAENMAVEANLFLKEQRLNVDIAAEGIAGAEAAFKPTLLANVNDSHQVFLPSSFTQLTSGSITQASAQDQLQVTQSLPWLGGSYNTSWTNNRQTTTTPSPVFNPQLSSSVFFQYTQPLLRNLKTDVNRTTLANSQTQRHVADLDLDLQTTTIKSQVDQAYLNLEAAKAGADVAQQNLETAQLQLHQIQRQLDVGIKAKVDVIADDLIVQQNQVQLVFAQSNLKDAQDQLRALILDPTRPDYWIVEVNPTDPLVIEKKDIDLDQSIKTALANRLDVKEAEGQLEIAQRTLRLDGELTKTQVNAVAQYSALSSGGTQFTYNGLSTAPSGSTTKSLSTVLGETFSGAFPSWAVAVNVSYPIGRSAAEAQVAQQTLVVKQAQIALADLQRAVAASVRIAARAVNTNYLALQATKAALQAAQDQLDAENKKQEVGTSDAFTMAQKISQLTLARVADLQQQINYNAALLSFERQLKVK